MTENNDLIECPYCGGTDIMCALCGGNRKITRKAYDAYWGLKYPNVYTFERIRRECPRCRQMIS